MPQKFHGAIELARHPVGRAERDHGARMVYAEFERFFQRLNPEVREMAFAQLEFGEIDELIRILCQRLDLLFGDFAVLLDRQIDDRLRIFRIFEKLHGDRSCTSPSSATWSLLFSCSAVRKAVAASLAAPGFAEHPAKVRPDETKLGRFLRRLLVKGERLGIAAILPLEKGRRERAQRGCPDGPR